MFFTLVRRDLTLLVRSPALWMPVVFFILVAAIFPFAIGPDVRLLARIAPGIVWVAALLAALLPIDRLVRPDKDAGVLDQLAVRGIADKECTPFAIVSGDLRRHRPALHRVDIDG